MSEAGTLLVIPKVSKCNANCRFCISENLRELGVEIIEEKPLDLEHLQRVIRFSTRLGINDANITGGSEPTLADLSTLKNIIGTLSNSFGRVTLYTNGANLLKECWDKTLISELSESGLTNIVISRAHYLDSENSNIMRISKYNFPETIAKLSRLNIDLKLSCLLTKKGIGTEKKIRDYLEMMRKQAVKKVIFREMFKVTDNRPVGEWIKNNYVSIELVKYIMEKMGLPQYEGLWNQLVFDYKGMAVTFWPDNSRKDTINHGDLIYMPNNCLYSSWNFSSSRIM